MYRLSPLLFIVCSFVLAKNDFSEILRNPNFKRFRPEIKQIMLSEIVDIANFKLKNTRKNRTKSCHPYADHKIISRQGSFGKEHVLTLKPKSTGYYLEVPKIVFQELDLGPKRQFSRLPSSTGSSPSSFRFRFQDDSSVNAVSICHLAAVLGIVNYPRKI